MKDEFTTEGMEIEINPIVLEAIDFFSLTSLQGLILHYVTDPNVEYTNQAIAKICQNILKQGSKRSVRRFKQEKKDIIDEVMLKREVNRLGNDVTPDHPEFDKGGNGEDKSPEALNIKEDGDGFWDVTDELDCVKTCGKVKEVAYVYLSAIVRQKIRFFMTWAKREEWLAYLVGRWISDNEVEVTDLALPSQNANAALVSNVNMEDYNKLGIVGVAHSHHEMGHGTEDNPGFSGHDEEFINSNHNVSLLVSTKGCAGHVRLKTPCGAFIRVKAKIKEKNEVTMDEKSLKKEFMEKIRFGRGRGTYHKSFTIGEDGRVNYDRNNWHY